MNPEHTMCEWQFQDSYYLNAPSLWLDPRIGGTTARRVLTFVTVAFATLLGGCVQDGLMDMARFQMKPDDIIIERRPDTAYEKLFPYYVELCAASQFHSKLTGEGGGPAGHAILYNQRRLSRRGCPFPATATLPRGCNESERSGARRRGQRQPAVQERQLGSDARL